MGVALFAFGLLGFFVVVGPVGEKLLLIAAFLHGAIAMALGAVRA